MADSSDTDDLLDAVVDRGIVGLDASGHIVRWNAGAESMLGYTRAEALGQHVASLLVDDDQLDAVQRELQTAATDGRHEFEGWRKRKDGHRFRARIAISAIRDQSGAITGFAQVLNDLVADQHRAHSMFYDLLDAAPDAMVIVESNGRIVLANSQTDRLFGYPREELVGSELDVLLPPRFRGGHARHRQSFFKNPTLRQMGSGIDLWGLRRDQTEFPVDISLSPITINGEMYVSAAIRDVTDRHERERELISQHRELVETQQILERLARIDALTGLANHAETITRLESALLDRRVPGVQLGVLFCDVDHFKKVNDTWGHNAGDTVLATMAERIRAGVRQGDTVGRIGGDEMLVLLPGVNSIQEVVDVAEGIRRRVAEPIDHAGQSIEVSMSIGATLAAPDESVAEMTTRVDAAMYKAKRAGRNRVVTV